MKNLLTVPLLTLLCVGVGYGQAAETLSPTISDIPYGPYERNVLDFWAAPGEGPHPVVVYIHGGGWTGGDKTRRPEQVTPFLEQGISYAAVRYRLTPDNPLPAPVYDAVRAIQFIKTKAAEWNIDPERIGLTGGSAGAATSMWILAHDDLADPGSPDPVLRQSSRVAAAGVSVGQTSIDPRVIEPWLGPNVLQHRMINMAVGEETIEGALAHYDQYQATYEEFSAINHLTADDPPLLMTYGSDMTLPSKDAGHGIHHGFYGVKMKEKADAVGHETHLLIDGYSSSGRYESIDDFLMKVLLGE